MLRLEKCSKRNAIFGFTEEATNLEVALEAIKTLDLQMGRSYYIGSGRCFFNYESKNYATMHCHRENWNGWNDLFKFNPQTGERYGEVTRVAPEHGQHRQSFV
jgi:hypothetical protein